MKTNNTLGLRELVGKKVTLFCVNYFYHGTLGDVSDTCVRLEEPEIVYNTGNWSDKKYQDAQLMTSNSLYVQTAAIEAFGVIKG